MAKAMVSWLVVDLFVRVLALFDLLVVTGIFLHSVPVLGQNGHALLVLWCIEAVIKL